MGTLSGKRAWITGAGTGLGAASAVALAESGAEIVLTGRRVGPLGEIAAEVEAVGGTAEVLPLDVSDRDAVAEAAGKLGQIDILFANAGLNVPKRSLSDLATADWDTVVSVNLNGVLYAIQAVLPWMRAAGAGTLILTGSWAGRYGTRMTGAAYNATKRAVIALGEAVNEEEGGHGIRATVLMPGEVATPILDARPVPPSDTQKARMLQSEDLAATVRFIAEMPPRVCINEILISPTWNRFYRGMEEVPGH
ncbi:SDR family oxidoreductase [Chachezhania antarctica]|uniref:SDR family oxidoreductase n=1 Tax=Chachezhania antarctica TaxID=2340860 RepID=UPI000EACA3E1|nr:SDR family oxidoreductase [Chachezhania antarctica]|tara:strand:- start:5184 stop:5936 length:753 start_codon:yes stop_codon:yes gene_type:complete